MIMHVIDANGHLIGDIDLTGSLWRVKGPGLVNIEAIDIPDPQPGEAKTIRMIDHDGSELDCDGECSAIIGSHGSILRFAPGTFTLFWTKKGDDARTEHKSFMQKLLGK